MTAVDVSLSPTLAERFWGKVDKNGPVHPTLGTRCWVWTAPGMRLGYGRIFIGWSFDGRKISEQSHRAVFRLDGAEPPIVVRHRCDNPPCVNPAHLEPGTIADNNRDMWERGRAVAPPLATGKRYAAKLTEAQVQEISALCGVIPQRKIAKMYGIGQATVSDIARGHTWAPLMESA